MSVTVLLRYPLRFCSAIYKVLSITEGAAILVIAYVDLEDQLDYLVLNDSPDVFPLGSFLFVNLTKQHTIGLIEQDKLALKPFEMTTIIPNKANRSYLNTKLAYWDNEKEEWVNSLTTRWLHRENARILTLILPKDSAAKEFTIKSIAQYPTALKKYLNYTSDQP